MGKPAIVCVDDEDMILASLKEQLGRDLGATHDIETASSGEEALEMIADLERDGVACPLVIADQIMPGLKGHELLRECHRRWPAMKKVMLTGQADAGVVGQAVNEAGLYRFLSKPWSRHDLLLTVRGAIESHAAVIALAVETGRRERVSRELLRLFSERLTGPLLGRSPAVRRLRAAISDHAAHAKPVVVAGPPGAGLEATARAVHAESGRDAFIFVDCALVDGPDQILDGADGGSAALAVRGTLYLHGADRLGREAQARVAELLAAGTLDVRVIASVFTDSAVRNLTAALQRALGSHRIVVPPLRERLDDLDEIAGYFLRDCARRFGRPVERFSEASTAQMHAYPWPGNVRELRQAVERAVLCAGGPVAEIDEALAEAGAGFGSYRLVERLGEGGMGEVWRARHRHLARGAAVKFVGGTARRDDALARFRREAHATALLRSPHTVELYDFGVADDGRLYYAMELLDGLDLWTLVERFGRMPPARAVRVLQQACRSLQEAHDAGLVHRDVKPANLFLCRLGVDLDFLKVLDFGMVSTPGPDDGRLTGEGVCGTPAFLSPEAAMGEALDGRADVYGLGCVGFWLLTGSLVFPRHTAVAMTMAHVTAPPPTFASIGVDDVPAGLEALIQACLAKPPADRPASAMELHRRLGALAIERWTEEDAGAWWQAHGSAVPAAPSGGDDTPPAVSDRAPVTVIFRPS